DRAVGHLHLVHGVKIGGGGRHGRGLHVHSVRLDGAHIASQGREGGPGDQQAACRGCPKRFVHDRELSCTAQSLSRRHDPMKGSGAASDCRTPAQSATTVAEPRQCSPSIRWNSNSVVLPVASALLAEEGTVGVAVIQVGQHPIVLQEKTPVYWSDCGTSCRCSPPRRCIRCC